MSITAISATLLLLAAVDPAPAPAKPDPDQERVICKNETIGTRFKKRVCRTKAEWEQITKDSQAAVKEIQERPGIVPCPPTAPGC
jgi:hypothetical protein